tara:strand:- start:823 stop:1080 length:258 start_codon:yes stop_codon:yes gene_type:complete
MSIEEVEKIISSIDEDMSDDFIVYTGKQGAIEAEIEFRKCFRKESDMKSYTEEELNELREHLNENMEEGMYKISRLGIKYMGKSK